ncbi:MAG: peptidylprolyl isomerase [Flavobacteriaceae bacterium]|nr:peptidylprolyl isomerase [Flavobacteriaceae bacterium]
MNTRNLLLLFLFIGYFNGNAQNKKNVLLTINSNPVYSSDFTKVFNKNLDLVVEESQKNVAGYLDLFIDYKLKITEAYAQELDKNQQYIKEFKKYEDQLAKKYIYDKRVVSKLVEEAYDRSLEEINAEHILVLSNLNDSPNDTLKAYNKIKEAHVKALKGENFTSLVIEYSEEPGAKKSKGKLGYFTAFQMVYPFENTAYNTKVGEISQITRTSFGYHIIKINDRRKKKPKINVSHIMIFSNKDKKAEDPEERINELYAMIMQGEPFEKIAKQFSEDKNTGVKGGQLKTFGPGDLKAPKFENAAYSIKNEGEIIAPIQSAFGWHIIRLNEKFSIPSFEEQKDDIEKKVKGGARALVVTQAINNKIIKKYGFKEGESYMSYFNNFVNDSILSRKWTYSSIPLTENQILFTIGDHDVTYNDYAEYLRDNQKTIKKYINKESLLIDMYVKFKNETLKNYFKERLEVENTEYATIINDYRNGLLVYDVMNKNIWQIAKTDSTGLKDYYEKTKNNYKWKKRLDVDIYSSSDEITTKQVQTLLMRGEESATIKKQINSDGKINVITVSDVFEIDQSELPEDLIPEKGVSDIKLNDGFYVVVNIKEVIEPTLKEFDEVRGTVISDFQTEIEKKWMQSLRDKYEVKINNKSLKKLKKKLDN